MRNGFFSRKTPKPGVHDTQPDRWRCSVEAWQRSPERGIGAENQRLSPGELPFGMLALRLALQKKAIEAFFSYVAAFLAKQVLDRAHGGRKSLSLF